MSAFVCILDRSGTNLDQDDIQRLTEPLKSYGDTIASLSRGPVAVAIRHSETRSPGKRGSPLFESDTGLVLALTGQCHVIDNVPLSGEANSQLLASGLVSRMIRGDSDGDLRFLADLSGSFVIIHADPKHKSLSIARDHLGAQKVYYYLDQRWLIAASEPAAILRHRAVSNDLDEGAAARFLGFRFSQSDSSFFRVIKELPPAHRLRVTASDSTSEQYWQFRRYEIADRTSLEQEEISSGFRQLIRRSISNQLSGLDSKEVALSTSGGLDSPVLAALAPRGIRSYSWHFEDTADCNENENIEEVATYLDMPVHWVKGDGFYPLCGDFIDRFPHRSSPYLNPFSALKFQLYSTAKAEGCKRVMVGDGGDALFSPAEYWLRDSLIQRRPGAMGSLIRTGSRAIRGDHFAQLALRRLFPVRGLRRVVQPGRPRWMTSVGYDCLPKQAFSPILPEGFGKHRWDLSVGTRHRELESEERRLFAQCGVGRSNPFWDWPLLEMVLNLPAYWYHLDGESKVLTRRAMRGRLPDRVLRSGRIGLLGSFFLRGIELNRAKIRETVFLHPRSDWQRYLDRAWLEPFLEATRSIQFGHTILWRAISYELWQRKLMQ